MPASAPAHRPPRFASTSSWRHQGDPELTKPRGGARAVAAREQGEGDPLGGRAVVESLLLWCWSEVGAGGDETEQRNLVVVLRCGARVEGLSLEDVADKRVEVLALHFRRQHLARELLLRVVLLGARCCGGAVGARLLLRARGRCSGRAGCYSARGLLLRAVAPGERGRQASQRRISGPTVLAMDPYQFDPKSAFTVLAMDPESATFETSAPRASGPLPCQEGDPCDTCMCGEGYQCDAEQRCMPQQEDLCPPAVAILIRDIRKFEQDGCKAVGTDATQCHPKELDRFVIEHDKLNDLLLQLQHTLTVHFDQNEPGAEPHAARRAVDRRARRDAA